MHSCNLLRIAGLSLGLLFAGVFTAFSQNVHEHYQDGKLYFKLADDKPLVLKVQKGKGLIDTKDVALGDYPFLQSLSAQFGITKVIRPFHLAKESNELVRTFMVEFSQPEQVDAFVRTLEAMEHVEYAEKVPLHELTLTPNDTYHNASTMWNLFKINAEQAWNVSTGSSSIVVAVTDNAIQTTHSDLTNVIWTNPGEIAGNGIDDDGNGSIDDVNGWDVADDDANVEPPTNAWDHGTHVAGTIGAETDNNTGVSSIGFGISVMPIKVTRNSASSSSVTNGYDGIYYAALTGADVINCSWGGYGSSGTGQNLVNWAWNQGSIVVCAAGNDDLDMDLAGNGHYPSNYNNAVCVASSRTTDGKSSFSNYGSDVDVTAPGSSIASTVPNNTYTTMSGTSMASPLVAGLLGLMKSVNPSMPNQDLVNCLITTCDDISSQNPGYTGDLGSGRINAFAAMNCVSATLNNPPVAEFQANFTTITAGGTVQFTDLSTYNPTTWSWNFDVGALGGVVPSTASTQGPHNVTFNNPGTYEVSLTVTNANGSDTETKTAYIQVNAAGSCNMPNFTDWTDLNANWNPVLYSDPGGGWVGGTNSYGDIAKAEYFPSASIGASQYVTGAYVWFARAYSTTPTKTIDVNVWDGTGGTVGAVLGTATLEMGDLTNGTLAYVEFPNPVAVPGSAEIFVGVDFSNLTLGPDSLAIVTSTDGDPTTTQGWEQWSDNSWNNYSVWGFAGQVSNYIFPTLTDDTAKAVISASSTSICEGESIDFDATGSTFDDTLVWNFFGASPATSNNVTENMVFNSAGTYTQYLQVIGGGCSDYAIDSIEITVNAAPTVNITSPDVDLCVGDNTTLTASGSAATYLWAPGGQTSASITVSPTVSTTYSVTASSAGCDAQASITVNVGEYPVLSATTMDASCNGGSDGSIDLTVTGNTGNLTYSWDNGATTEDITGLAAGAYTVTVTSEYGCSNNDTYTVGEAAAISATANTTDALCNGSSDGTATLNISGGTPTYFQDWGAANPSALSAGSHNYTITDANGCTFNGSVTIGQPTSITGASTTTDANCGSSDGTATVTASGGTPGYTFDIGSGPQTGTFTALAVGSYTCTITDANGCTGTEIFSISNLSGPSITGSNSTDATCNGASDGTASVTYTGGTAPYTEDWGTFNPNALPAGTYSVTVTDNNGCGTSTTVTVSEPASLIATETTTDVLCNGNSDGTATLNISGGTPTYVEDWGTANSSALGAGSHSYTVTDANGCTFNGSVTITEPTALSLSLNSTSDALCNGGSDGGLDVTASGGTSGYTYDIGGAGQASGSFGGLTAGSYTPIVTDANGCTASVSATINEPTALSLTLNSSTDVLCNGGADGDLDVIASGGTASYTYDIGGAGQASGAFSGLTAGSYTPVVTDANGCTASVSVTITQPTVLAAVPSPSDATCFGAADGMANLTVTGGTPGYTEDWGTMDPNALPPGTHSVTVTDANGCTTSANVTIAAPTQISITGSVTDESVAGTNDGAIDANVSGGSPGYTFSWSSGQTTEDITGLAPGTYTLTATDANGCTSDTTFTVLAGTNGLEDLERLGMKVYPVPSTDVLNVVLEGDFNYELKNPLGQVVLSAQAHDHARLNLESLADGVYHLVVEHREGERVSVPVIKN